VNHQPISIIFEIALVAVSVTGYFIGISGAIANSLSWHYGNDAKTRIYIGPQMKVSNKFREKTRNLRFNNMQNVPGIH
jgi:predicted lipoprotein